MKLKPTPTF